MAQKIVQTQALQQVQTLSPQQVLQVRLLEMPLAELEERVKNELIDNGALEERLDAPREDGPAVETDGDYDGEDARENDDPAADGGLPADDYRTPEVQQAMDDYRTADDVPDYLWQQDQSRPSRPENMDYSSTTSFSAEPSYTVRL